MRIQTSSDQGIGTILVRGNDLTMNDNSFLFSDIRVRGQSSEARVGIDIDLSGRLRLSDGARITSEVDFLGKGSAGDIVIKADQIEVSGVGTDGSESLIGSRLFPGSSAAGADIDITANKLSVTGGAGISTETNASGAAGAIRITANTIDLSSGGKITSATSGTGLGGTITLQANNLSLADGAAISAAAIVPDPESILRTGNAGDITIHVRDSLRIANSSIMTTAENADGGNIHLTVGRLVDLFNGQITATVKSGFGDGGNITIDPTFVTLNHSHITANAFGGRGGNVTIVSDVFLKSTDSSVTASSALSTPGTVDIQAPITDLSGALAPLPENVLQATALLRQSCAARFAGGKLSSLVVGTRDGLPLEPGAFMPSPLYRFDSSPNPSAVLERKSDRAQRRAPGWLALAKPSLLVTSPCSR